MSKVTFKKLRLIYFIPIVFTVLVFFTSCEEIEEIIKKTFFQPTGETFEVLETAYICAAPQIILKVSSTVDRKFEIIELIASNPETGEHDVISFDKRNIYEDPIVVMIKPSYIAPRDAPWHLRGEAFLPGNTSPVADGEKMMEFTQCERIEDYLILQPVSD